MLDRVHLHVAFRDGRRPFDEFYMVNLRIDRRLIRQIHALKLDPMIDRRRAQSQAHLRPSVQGDTRETRALRQRLLVKKSHK